MVDEVDAGYVSRGAGYLTKFGGKLTLTMNRNDVIPNEILKYLRRLQFAAT